MLLKPHGERSKRPRELRRWLDESLREKSHSPPSNFPGILALIGSISNAGVRRTKDFGVRYYRNCGGRGNSILLFVLAEGLSMVCFLSLQTLWISAAEMRTPRVRGLPSKIFVGAAGWTTIPNFPPCNRGHKMHCWRRKTSMPCCPRSRVHRSLLVNGLPRLWRIVGLRFWKTETGLQTSC